MNFLNKQLNTLAPNVIFVSSGQNGFRAGSSSTPTIVLNSEVVNRLKSLPFVQDAVPSYQGQLQLNAQGNILNSQVLAMDPQKIYLIDPSLQLVDSSSIQSNNPSAMLVGDTYLLTLRVSQHRLLQWVKLSERRCNSSTQKPERLSNNLRVCNNWNN